MRTKSKMTEESESISIQEKNKGFPAILLQINIFIFALASLFVKLASSEISANGIFSILSLVYLAAFGILLILHAYIWQINLRTYPLNTAYAIKSLNIVWLQLFGVIFLSETIRWNHIAGVILILAGTLVVAKDEN